MVFEQRVSFPKLVDNLGKITYLLGFRTADINIAACYLIESFEFIGGFVHHKSVKVNHREVIFHNRYVITPAADLYEPKNATGKLSAIYESAEAVI